MAVTDIVCDTAELAIVEIPLGSAPGAYVDNGYTLLQSVRVMLAALAGKISGAAGTTITIRNPADTKDVIVATVDANGNRTAVTIDAT